MVESEEFVSMIRTLNSSKTTLSHSTLGRHIDDIHQAVEEALINTFDVLTYLATTADCWTAHNRALCWTKSEHFAGPNLVSCVRQPSGTDKVDCASIVHHNINRYKA
ncbi:uncharacterized protein [Panulirus ornatus]|uniref:uncharacterized protein isoform X1 n=1 Tax=Panulirus ornatus TaxID=150431 RepID=UPI003A89EC46